MMPGRFALTFIMALGLGGLCAGYVYVTRPLLAPAASRGQREVAGESRVPTGPRDARAAKYLPGEPWAADATYILQIQNGESTIFFNKWETVEDNKAIRLEPFAMIFPPDEESDDDTPLTLAGDAAILRVEGSTDLSNPDPGRIIGGTVPGKARLRGPDDLRINGANFNFNEDAQRLWSDDDVYFRQGQNAGRGHGMQLELFRVGDASEYRTMAVSGVKVFRLLRDVSMELVLEDGDDAGPFANLSGGETPSAASSESDPNTPPTPTFIESTGAFTFDLETNIARFDENVVATRPARNGQPDRLECDTLEIEFEPSTPEARLAAADRRQKIQNGTLTEQDGFQGPDAKLKPTRLIAQGHERAATLHSPTNEFSAAFDMLIYDAATGETRLSRAGNVVARQKTSQLESPSIRMIPREGDLPPSIICEGAGKLHHRNEAGELELSVYWKERLTRARQRNQMDLIQLVGQAQVNQPQENFVLVGDEIDLWLLPTKQESKKPQSAAIVDSNQVEPYKLHARNNVMLRGPELNADAQKLNVIFTEPTPEEVANFDARGRLTLASKRVQQVSAESDPAPEETAAPSAPSTEPANERRPNPIEMVAQVINVEMLRGVPNDPASTEADGNSFGGDTRIRLVRTEGGVAVRQRREGSDPLKINGDRLELINHGKNREVIHIYGRYGGVTESGTPRGPEPAQVHDGESDLWGMNINLDRGKNTAWVDGEGILLLPVDQQSDVLPFGQSAPAPEPQAPSAPNGGATLATNAGEPPKSRLEIRWAERMDFDGKKAIFLGDVRTSLNHDDLVCQQMEVDLVNRINFASLGNDERDEGEDNRPDVATIYCKHRVVVDGGEYEEDQLVSRRHAEFSDLHVDYQTGDTRANGPGLIKMWSLGQSATPEDAMGGAARANVMPREDSIVNWEYTYVEFAGTSEGNIHHLTTTFNNQVTAIYGPVSNHTQELDPHRIDLAPKEAGWLNCSHLTLTRHKATDTTAAYSEALARGNVRLSGRDFQGNADQVTFDESKDQYILKSFDGRNATVQMGRENVQKGEAFKFFPQRKDLQVVNARGGEAVPR